eukprot:scaffold47912_cov73-Phaeocystis_antarctica.AAC.7
MRLLIVEKWRRMRTATTSSETPLIGASRPGVAERAPPRAPSCSPSKAPPPLQDAHLRRIERFERAQQFVFELAPQVHIRAVPGQAGRPLLAQAGHLGGEELDKCVRSDELRAAYQPSARQVVSTGLSNSQQCMSLHRRKQGEEVVLGDRRQ